MANIQVFGVLLLAIGTIGFLITAILIFSNQEHRLASILLAALVFSLSVIIASNAAYTSDFFLQQPHLYRLFSFLSFCIGPFSYLYVRTVLYHALALRPIDFLYFIPSALYWFNRIPFIFQSASEKSQSIAMALENKALIALEPEGLLPQGWTAIFRVLTGVVFLFFQVRLLIRWRKNRPGTITPDSNAERFKWLALLTAILSFGFLAVFIETIFHINRVTTENLIVATIAFCILFISSYLLAKPKILYGMSGWPTNEESKETEDKENPRPYQINQQQRQTISEKLNHWKEKEKGFLNQGFTLRDLSDQISIPSYQVSAFINQEFDRSFNDYINDLRIDHFMHQIKNDPRTTNFTIQSIGEELGFRSRTSFIAALKKRTGKTPSELIGKADS